MLGAGTCGRLTVIVPDAQKESPATKGPANIPAQAVEATEPQQEPCEYCSIAANALKVHDGSCDGMTEQEWRELRGEGVGHE